VRIFRIYSTNRKKVIKKLGGYLFKIYSTKKKGIQKLRGYSEYIQPIGKRNVKSCESIQNIFNQ